MNGVLVSAPEWLGVVVDWTGGGGKKARGAGQQDVGPFSPERATVGLGEEEGRAISYQAQQSTPLPQRYIHGITRTDPFLLLPGQRQEGDLLERAGCRLRPLPSLVQCTRVQ